MLLLHAHYHKQVGAHADGGCGTRTKKDEMCASGAETMGARARVMWEGQALIRMLRGSCLLRHALLRAG